MLQLNILGNLGRDAEVKTINDKQYLSFSVASTEKQGEQEQTTWVSVLASNNPNLLPFLKKGQQVFVSGRMKAGIYQSQQNFGIDISVYAQTLQLCGGKKEESVQSGSPASPAPVQQQPAPQPQVSSPVIPSQPIETSEDGTDGLPF